MSNPILVVHRATCEIGGNCIEIRASSGERILLDAGRPLDAPREATGLLPATLDRAAPVAGVLVSHPHQDHFGLLNEIPGHWPIHAGPYASRLIKITSDLQGQTAPRENLAWKSDESFPIGPFRITPTLTDHSAFDAYMLLVEVEGRRILYSGDFRMHGRKAALVRRFMRKPPAAVDVLLMEGTNLGTTKPTRTEAALEQDFIALFKRTPGRVFVSWSAQNIDRTVTLYRACKQTGRTLVVDLYTADVMDQLKDAGQLPHPEWPHLKVVITRAFARLYKSRGRGDFVERMAQHGISARALAEHPGRWVSMIRPSLIRDFEYKGVRPNADDAWSSPNGAAICASPMASSSPPGSTLADRRPSTSTPPAMRLPMTCGHSQRPSVRSAWCRFTALPGIRNWKDFRCSGGCGMGSHWRYEAPKMFAMVWMCSG